MKALCWQGPGQVSVDDVPDPTITAADDVIVRVTSCAICGSDLHLLHGKVPKCEPGMVLGHEFVGIVEEAGPGVQSVRAGDRVLSSMYTACGRCQACIAGRYSLCGSSAIFGYGGMFGSLSGGQAEYVRVPLADVTLSHVPEALHDDDVLFVGDILSTAYTGCLAAGIRPGDTVVIVGAGPVGQLAVQCAQLFGPANVVVLDMVPERLRAAESFGAIGLDLSGGQDPLALVREVTKGRAAEVVIEAVGNAKSLETAWRVAATGSTIAIVGFLVDEPFPQSAGRTWMRGITVKPIFGEPINHRDHLIRLVEAGKLNPAGVITRHAPLSDAAAQYAALDGRETTKVVLHPSQVGTAPTGGTV